MARQFDVSIIVGMRDNASRALGTMQRTFRSNFRGIEALGTRAIRSVEVGFARLANRAKWVTAGLAALGVLGIRASINEFADYEQSVRNAVTVTGMVGDAAAKAEREMFALGLQLARTSMKTATEVAASFYELASAGLSVEESMNAARGVIALAEGTLSDMETSAQLVTSQLAAFGLGVEHTDRLVNLFAATTAATLLKMSDLAVAFPYVGASARALGVSVEDTAASLGLLRSAGLDASMAGTGLRMTFMRLSKQTGAGQKVLKKYGLTMADLNVQQRGLIPVLKTLGAANISYADTLQLFDARGATAAQTLMRQADQLDGLKQKITGTNMAYQMQRQQLDTLQGRWKVFLSTLKEAYTRLGQRLSPALSGVLDGVNALLARLMDTGVIARWGDALAKGFQRVEDWMKGGGVDRMIAGFGKMKEQVLAKVRELQASVSAEWAAATKSGKAAGVGLWKWLIGEGPFPKDALKEFQASMTAAIVAAWNAVMADLTQRLPSLTDIVMKVFSVNEAEAGKIVEGWRALGAEVGKNLVDILRAAKELVPMLLEVMKGLLQFGADNPGIAQFAILALIFQKLTGLLPLLVGWLARGVGWLLKVGGVTAWVEAAVARLGLSASALGGAWLPVIGQIIVLTVSLYEIIKTLIAGWDAFMARLGQKKSEKEMLTALGAEGRPAAEVVGEAITPEQLAYNRRQLGLPPVQSGAPAVTAPGRRAASGVTVNVNAPVFGVDDLEAKMQALASTQVRDALAPA